MSIAVTTREKRAGWTRAHANVNFDRFAELIAGETITGTPTFTKVSGDTSLTISFVAVSGSLVQFSMSGGTVAALYVYTCTIVTSGGSTLSQDVSIAVVA